MARFLGRPAARGLGADLSECCWGRSRQIETGSGWSGPKSEKMFFCVCATVEYHRWSVERGLREWFPLMPEGKTWRHSGTLTIVDGRKKERSRIKEITPTWTLTSETHTLDSLSHEVLWGNSVTCGQGVDQRVHDQLEVWISQFPSSLVAVAQSRTCDWRCKTVQQNLPDGLCQVGFLTFPFISLPPPFIKRRRFQGDFAQRGSNYFNLPVGHDLGDKLKKKSPWWQKGKPRGRPCPPTTWLPSLRLLKLLSRASWLSPGRPGDATRSDVGPQTATRSLVKNGALDWTVWSTEKSIFPVSFGLPPDFQRPPTILPALCPRDRPGTRGVPWELPKCLASLVLEPLRGQLKNYNKHTAKYEMVKWMKYPLNQDIMCSPKNCIFININPWWAKRVKSKSSPQENRNYK
jgi:hypothetical protein